MHVTRNNRRNITMGTFKSRKLFTVPVAVGLPILFLVGTMFIITNYTTIKIETTPLSVSTSLRKKTTRVSNMKATEVITVRWHKRPSYISTAKMVGWFSSCNHSCQYTKDINSHILLFDANIIGKRPKRINPRQIWVFYNPESPHITFSHKWRDPSWNGQFNRTMSYRLDSDVNARYGYHIKRRHPLRKNRTEVMQNKTKMAAILRSNCKTPGRREDYLKLLRKYIPVDSYGRCEKLSCHMANYCNIDKKYKFYLAFENSFCKDYATEKFFRAEGWDLVTVARGGANYSLLAPEKSYILTSDFKSVKELAEYLIYLDKNDTAYMEYIEKKWKYEVFSTLVHGSAYVKRWCNFCEQAHSWLKENNNHSYEHIKEWYETDKCHKPTDLH
ncbi:alpha-(1,3)-fucosyltransferase C-like [Patella vulgata]|uniref:alpha-(1,3)-fucosyltransferase C-like n=1 Tax=Patella vulgata TaxID=6465 RepID=UPI0024A80091|nr:alpha-(1,3)-fucosyltransferase C-like [Patella vulgata]